MIREIIDKNSLLIKETGDPFVDSDARVIGYLVDPEKVDKALNINKINAKKLGRNCKNCYLWAIKACKIC